VELVSADTQRAYVSGLPDPVTLITLGAGLVSPGEAVTPVPAQEGGHAPVN
ncbi:MAG TPA: efflux RND transporter periplasmic adaptor subunit, partial [Halomonas sp.]|nr:efflux RND transporter periplasmic adaptor subunit [Halomonas sp.]